MGCSFASRRACPKQLASGGGRVIEGPRLGLITSVVAWFVVELGSIVGLPIVVLVFIGGVVKTILLVTLGIVVTLIGACVGVISVLISKLFVILVDCIAIAEMVDG